MIAPFVSLLYLVTGVNFLQIAAVSGSYLATAKQNSHCVDSVTTYGGIHHIIILRVHCNSINAPVVPVVLMVSHDNDVASSGGIVIGLTILRQWRGCL